MPAEASSAGGSSKRAILRAGRSMVSSCMAGAGFGSIAMQIGYSFLIGGLCSFVLLKTGNIAFCVLLHATFNFTGTLVERLGTGGWGGWLTAIITLVVALPVAVYVVYSLIKIPTETTDKLY